MISIKDNPLYKLFFLLSKKRKRQLYFLVILLIINGFFESFSIGALIPYISILALKDEVNTLPVIGELLNILGFTNPSQSFLLVTILFCILILFTTFFRLFNMRYIIKFTANLEIEISKLIFKNNIYQSYIKYTKRNSSEVITITIDKVSATASALCSFLNLVGSIILGTFILGSLLVINWKIVALGIIFLVFYYLIIVQKVKKILTINGNLLAHMGPVRLRLLQEVFFGFRDVIVNGTEKIYIKTFKKLDSEFKLRSANSGFISLFPRSLIEGLIILMIAIFGYYLFLLDFEIAYFLPLFGTFIYAFQRLLPLIQQIYSTWANYLTKYQSICEVIEELENNKNDELIISSNNEFKFTKNIKLNKIYFAYDFNSDIILKDINLQINKGEHIGIYGETGNGKSTFLDIVLGLLPPLKGKILIDNIDIYKENKNNIWTSKIAHVSQNVFLKEGTIAENIAYGESLETINFDLLVKVSKSAYLYDFIKKSERSFKTYVGERGIRLSGGQRQRIAIARALYKSREILVLDEATSALDHATEEKIINTIKTNNNITILMVTHRLKTLELCDRVFEVKNKNIIEHKNY